MPAGRHRSFDKEEALETAMRIFWQNGYASTSLADLTQAMGINKPSLYAAFGNKEQLFVAALAQYAKHHSAPNFDHLFAPNLPLEERLRAYLKSVAHLSSQPNLPGGCLVVNSICELAGDGMPEAAQQLVSGLNQTTKQQLIDFFAQEQADGNLKSESSPLALTLHLMSVSGGITVLARDGVPLAELDEMVEHIVQTIV